MKILSVDPSITATGWAVMDSEPIRVLTSGTWRPSEAKTAADRFIQLAEWAGRMLDNHEVAALVIETPSGGQRHSATQLMTYAQAIGVIRGTAAILGYPVRPVTVASWKGNAKKAQASLVARALSEGRQIEDHNESDAIGLGDWFLRIGRHLGM